MCVCVCVDACSHDLYSVPSSSCACLIHRISLSLSLSAFQIAAELASRPDADIRRPTFELLQQALPPNTSDMSLIAEAAKAVGMVVLNMKQTTRRGQLYVKSEAARALEWLQVRIKSDSWSYAGLLVLQQLAKNAPDVIYESVLRGSAYPNFFELLLSKIHDSKNTVREASAAALNECLQLTEQREGQTRERWYESIHRSIHDGFEVSDNSVLPPSTLPPLPTECAWWPCWDGGGGIRSASYRTDILLAICCRADVLTCAR